MSPQVWRQVRRLGALRGPVGDPEDTLARRFGLLAWLVPRRKVLLLTGTSVAGALCEAATLLVVINVASLVAGGDDRTDLPIGPIAVDQVATGQLLLAAASIAITRLVFHLLSSYLAARASADVLGKLRVTLPAAYLHASWPRQAATPSGHLQDLATTHVTESSRAALFSALALTAAVNFLIMVISAVVVSLVAAVVIAIGVGVLYLLFRPLTRVARARARLLAEANTAYATSVDEGARLAFETSSFGIADPFIGRLTRSARLSARRHFQVQLISRSLTGLYQNVALLALVLGLWVISSQDDAELATLGAIVIILLRALSYSQTFQSAQHTLNELLPFAQRARAEIVDYEAHRVEPGDQELASIEALRVEGVSFTYDAAPVLVDLSFDVRPGEAIGIVGPSGSGKSTLAQLLLRLRAPSEGRYLVNGRAAAEYSIPEWSRLVAVVPQEPHLLADTVRENVRFLRDVDDAAIERACRAAHIHDEILSWPEGYDTVLGSGSNPLSGGQRQRLCIARALAGAPDLLVLDEPTSALDMRSESAIQDTLEGLRGTVTLVIIAHRVPTLKLCDRVMVLAGGRVEAFAPPSELAHDNAFFAEALKLSRV